MPALEVEQAKTDAIESTSVFDRLKTRMMERVDSWVNPFTGQGTSRDKTAQGYFDAAVPLEPDECASLYHGDPIAARIVDLVPREMLRQGFTLERDAEGDAEAEEVYDDARVRDVEQAMKDLDVLERVLDAMIWGRCMGGALLFVGVDDGVEAHKPLVPENVESVVFLQVYDRRRVTVARRYSDARKKNFGEPEVYTINPIDGVAVGDGAGVHETRCIRFGGARTGEQERRQLDGWDHSVLQKVYEAIRRFHGNSAAAEHLMTDASQGVWKMAGFIDAIAGGNWSKLQSRIVATEMGRSVFKSIVVDADPKYGEDFTKVQNSFGGVGDMLDRSASYLSAATEIPVTVLMGQAPAGLSATGDADIRLFYDRVRTEQENKLKPVLLRIVEIVTGGERDGWNVCFPSLWQESPKEKAERQKLEADRDVLYITNEVVTPEEVALSPHVEEAYPSLDRELRETLQERATEHALAPPAPAPAALPAPTPAEDPNAAPTP